MTDRREIPAVTDEFGGPMEGPKPSRRLHIIGFWVSIIWVCGIVGFTILDLSEFRSLSPNEIGDFLGGVFAPMAFLWLVLGFLQQGEELRYSANALWLQGRELQHSVEQQRELVNVTREQLRFDSEMLKTQQEEAARRSQPIIQLRQGWNSSGGNGLRSQVFRIANVGKPATALKVFVDGELKKSTDILATGDQSEFSLELPVGEIEPFDVDITFLDERGLAGSVTYRVSGAGQFKITEIPAV